MSQDLEKQIIEMDDPSVVALVARIKAAPQAEASSEFNDRVMSAIDGKALGKIPRSRFNFHAAAAAAAALLLAAAGIYFAGHEAKDATAQYLVNIQRSDGTFSSASSASYAQAIAVQVLAEDASIDTSFRKSLESAVDSIVRSQTPDGGWANPVLSAWNVAALAAADSAGISAAKVPHMRGLRYIRACGISEIPANVFARAAHAALERFVADGSSDFAACCSASQFVMNGRR